MEGIKNDPDRFKNLIPVEFFRIRPKILAAKRVAVKVVKINLYLVDRRVFSISLKIRQFIFFSIRALNYAYFLDLIQTFKSFFTKGVSLLPL